MPTPIFLEEEGLGEKVKDYTSSILIPLFSSERKRGQG